MTGGDFLRAQIPSSTDPTRLRRMALAKDLYALAFKVQHQPPSRPPGTRTRRLPPCTFGWRPVKSETRWGKLSRRAPTGLPLSA